MPTYNVDEYGVVVVSSTDGNGDIAAYINDLLSDSQVKKVQLEAGLYVVHSAIVIPSGKTLTGAGRDSTIIQAAADFVPISAQHNGVVNSARGAVGVTLSDFSVDVNGVLPSGVRINGCMMKEATEFSIARVDVLNATGYAHFAQGDVNSLGVQASGTYDDCRTFNSQVHFEQMFANGVTLTNCHARDGSGTIATEAYFHPLVGSQNITYQGCSAVGNGLIGFSLVSIVRPLQNIRIIDCEIEITRAESGFGLAAIATLPILGLEIVNSRFVSDNYIGASLAGVTGIAVDSEFYGKVIGLEVSPSADGTQSSFIAENSFAVGVRSTTDGVGVYGIANTGPADSVIWNGGVIEAIGRAGYMFPISGAVVVSETTQVLDGGFDATRAQFQGGSPLALFSGVSIAGLADQELANGCVIFVLQSDAKTDDRISIVAPTFGDGLSLVGDELFFNHVLMGTVTTEPAGRIITVQLTSAITSQSLSALADAIMFTGASAGSEMRTLPAFVFVEDSGGERFETAVRVVVSPPTLMGTASADWLIGSDAGHSFDLRHGGHDLADGGAGADTFYFGSELRVTDFINGGSGNDTLIIQGDYSGARRIDFWSNFTGIERVQILSAGEGSYGALNTGSNCYEIRSNDFIVSPGATLTIDGRSLQISERLFYDGSLETDGYLKLHGGLGADVLIGGRASDFLDGGGGNDKLIGGAGNDIYYVDTGDLVVEEVMDGFDYVYARSDFGLSPGSEVEVLGSLDHRSTQSLLLSGNELNNAITGNNGYNRLLGGAGDDTLRGLSGADTLDGGIGRDYMIGGTGDDTYYVDHAMDTVFELGGEGYDRVFAYTSYAIPATSEVESLAAGDYRLITSMSLLGNQLNNSITGNNGDNVLDGLAGMDSLRGLAGNDVLVGGSGVDYMIGGVGDDLYRADEGDTVWEAVDEGFDTVYAESTYVLTFGSEVELLLAIQSEGVVSLDLTGNEFGQSILGNDADNRISGRGGADAISGLGGDDRIDGGAGADRLAGGLGSDVFVLSQVTDSGGNSIDTILDFESGLDLIDLSALDANLFNEGNDSFIYIGNAKFSGRAGELRVDEGEIVRVFGDIDGDGFADFQIDVVGTVPAAIDFIF